MLRLSAKTLSWVGCLSAGRISFSEQRPTEPVITRRSTEEFEKRWKSWLARQYNYSPATHATLRKIEEECDWERIDTLRTERLGVKAVRGHAIIHSLGIEANAIPLYRMYVKKDRSELMCVVAFSEGSTGHQGIVHGGVTAMLFDDTMGWMNAICRLHAEGELESFIASGGEMTKASTMLFGFTAYLHVNYRRPLPERVPVAIFRARLGRAEGRKLFLNASLEDASGQVFADAETLYIVPREKRPDELKK